MIGGTAVRCGAQDSALPADLDPPAPILNPSVGVHMFKATYKERNLWLLNEPMWLIIKVVQVAIPYLAY